MKKIINLNISLSKEDWCFLINTLDNIIEEKNEKYHQYLNIHDTILHELLEKDFLKITSYSKSGSTI
jgi:hypothetical protein